MNSNHSLGNAIVRVHESRKKGRLIMDRQKKTFRIGPNFKEGPATISDLYEYAKYSWLIYCPQCGKDCVLEPDRHPHKCLDCLQLDRIAAEGDVPLTEMAKDILGSTRD